VRVKLTNQQYIFLKENQCGRPPRVHSILPVLINGLISSSDKNYDLHIVNRNLLSFTMILIIGKLNRPVLSKTIFSIDFTPFVL